MITYRVHVPQHSSFVKRSIYEEVGSYDESLDFVFDLDFGLRLGLKGLKPLVIDHTLAGFRIHGKSKTESSRLPFLNEQLSLLEKYKEDISEDAARKAHRFLKQHIAAHTLFDSLNTAKNNPLPVLQAACRSIWIDAAIIKQRYFWGALKQAIWQENEYGN